MNVRTWALRLAVAVAALGLGGCSEMFAPRLRECRGFDVPLSELSGSAHKELRVRVRGGDVDRDIPFVVESSPESLVLVGFTPLGTKAFTLWRNEKRVRIDSRLGFGLGMGVPPRNLMEDVLAMSVPSPCSFERDGRATATIGEWEVRDDCEGGRPWRRYLVRVKKRLRPKPPAPSKEEATDSGPDAEAATAKESDEADEPAPPRGKNDAELAAEAEGAEVEVNYAHNGIVVTQYHCRYRARYVLQATAPMGQGYAGEEEDAEFFDDGPTEGGEAAAAVEESAEESAPAAEDAERAVGEAAAEGADDKPATKMK